MGLAFDERGRSISRSTSAVDRSRDRRARSIDLAIDEGTIASTPLARDFRADGRAEAIARS